MICKTYVISPDDYKTLGESLRADLVWLIKKVQFYAGLLIPFRDHRRPYPAWRPCVRRP